MRAYLGYGIEIDGKKIGLSSASKSIDLIFGSVIHKAVEDTLNILAKFQKNYVIETYDEEAKDKIKLAFDPNLFKVILNRSLEIFKEQKFVDFKIDSENEILVAYSLLEYKWLAEALFYAWWRYELPQIISKYFVILVEKEIDVLLTTVNIPKDPPVTMTNLVNTEEIILPSRCDALFYDLEEKCFISNSFKTIKMIGVFSEQIANRDLQTCTEIFALENWLNQAIETKSDILEKFSEVFDQPLRTRLEKFLNRILPDNVYKIEGVKYTFFVKGDRKLDNNASSEDLAKDYPFRACPFVYGWRKKLHANKLVKELDEGVEEVQEVWQYAHSFVFNNPENKSGEGRLGKGWERFPVATEYPTGIVGWIDDILNGYIQPEADNPISKIIQSTIDSRIDMQHEAQLHNAKLSAREYFKKRSEGIKGFSANTKSCTFPSPCDFLAICEYSGVNYFKPEIANDPLGSGLYQIRKPHHPSEEENYQNGE